nr:hypothetical protein TetV2_00440 [Oceanusvirus sp.]
MGKSGVRSTKPQRRKAARNQAWSAADQRLRNETPVRVLNMLFGMSFEEAVLSVIPREARVLIDQGNPIFGFRVVSEYAYETCYGRYYDNFVDLLDDNRHLIHPVRCLQHDDTMVVTIHTRDEYGSRLIDFRCSTSFW